MSASLTKAVGTSYIQTRKPAKLLIETDAICNGLRFAKVEPLMFEYVISGSI